jgi:hypothetical protein
MDNRASNIAVTYMGNKTNEIDDICSVTRHANKIMENFGGMDNSR